MGVESPQGPKLTFVDGRRAYVTPRGGRSNTYLDDFHVKNLGAQARGAP